MKFSQAIHNFETYLKADSRSPHTIGSYLHDLRLFQKWLDDNPDISSIKATSLHQFLASDSVLKKPDGSPRTKGSVNKIKTSFKSFFGWADKGMVVLGISKDNPKSHKRFIDKHELNFTLLSDPEGKICQSYGVLGEKKMFGKTLFGVIHRTTFVIDEEGKIARIYPKVKVKGHAAKVLSEL